MPEEATGCQRGRPPRATQRTASEPRDVAGRGGAVVWRHRGDVFLDALTADGTRRR